MYQRFPALTLRTVPITGGALHHRTPGFSSPIAAGRASGAGLPGWRCRPGMEDGSPSRQSELPHYDVSRTGNEQMLMNSQLGFRFPWDHPNAPYVLALRTSSARVSAPNFSRSVTTCLRTVLTDTISLRAISGTESSVASRGRRTASRSVR